MRLKNFVYLALGLLTLSCSSGPEIVLQLSNPMNQERQDAILLFSRGEIEGWTTIPENQLPFLKDLGGDLIPCQLDDLDGDGQWDELFGLCNLEADEMLKIKISFVDQDNYPVFPARTNLHLGDARNNYLKLDKAQRLEGVSYHNYGQLTGAAFQMEGPAWENDLVGFRNYLDQRNGMDIFGKTTADMVLDSVGMMGRPSYHEPDTWGMDVLKVGTSLGSGGIGYMYNDSIYRVGDNGSGNYQVLFRGPLRSRFKLNYSKWMVDDQEVNVSHQVEIVAGRHYFQGLVTYSGSDEDLDLVTGIVNMKCDSLHVLPLNENYTAIFTHDHQAEDGSLLTMALMLPKVYLKSVDQTRDQGEGITQTYYAVLDAHPGEAIPYRFYSLWENEDSRWTSLEEISLFLETEAERWTQSVVYGTRH